MSKPLSAFALLMGTAACAGVVFSAMQSRTIGEQLQKIDARLSAMEKAAPGGGPDVPKATDAPESQPSKMETWNDVVREVSQLREELDAAKSARPTAPATSSGDAVRVPEAAVTPAGEPTEALRKAVDDILAQKERDRVEAEKRKQAEAARARLDRTMTELTEKLMLTGQQKDQIQVILGDLWTKQTEMWQNRKEGDNPYQKMGELKKEADTAVKALLTSEQQSKYDEAMKMAGGFRVVQSTDGGAAAPIVPLPAR